MFSPSSSFQKEYLHSSPSVSFTFAYVVSRKLCLFCSNRSCNICNSHWISVITGAAATKMPLLISKKRPQFLSLIFGSSFTRGFCGFEKELRASQKSHSTVIFNTAQRILSIHMQPCHKLSGSVHCKRMSYMIWGGAVKKNNTKMKP